jgi:hypothetical protein
MKALSIIAACALAAGSTGASAIAGAAYKDALLFLTETPGKIRFESDSGVGYVTPLDLTAQQCSRLGVDRAAYALGFLRLESWGNDDAALHVAICDLDNYKSADSSTKLRVARERSAHGDTFIYDATIKLKESPKFAGQYAGLENVVTAFEIWDGTGVAIACVASEDAKWLKDQLGNGKALNAVVAVRPGFPGGWESNERVFHMVGIRAPHANEIADSRIDNVVVNWEPRARE